jgi:hypothetical protein
MDAATARTGLVLALVLLLACLAVLTVLYKKGLARVGGLTVLVFPCIGGIGYVIRLLTLPQVSRLDVAVAAVLVLGMVSGIPVLYLEDKRARLLGEKQPPV